MKPTPTRPPLPLPTFEVLLAGSTAAPTESDWSTALRLEASDAMDAADQATRRDMWHPVSWWVRTAGQRAALVVVDRPQEVRT